MSARTSIFQKIVETALTLTLPLFINSRPTLKVKALLVKTDRLGDLAIITPLVQTLITRFGPNQIALVVSEINVVFARQIFPGVHIFVVPIYLPPSRPRAWLAAMRAVSHIETEDAFLLLHFLHPPHLRAVWRTLKAKRLHWLRSAENVYPPKFIDRILLPGHALDFKGPPPETVGSALDAHLTNFVLASAYSQPLPNSVVPPPSFSSEAPPELGSRTLLFPFASDAYRDLTPELVTGIVHHLITAHHRQVLLCTTSERLEEAHALRAKITATHPEISPDAIQLWVPASFAQFYQAIIAARLIVSTDTGPAHLAILHDKPMIGLLGGGHFGRFAPWALSQRQQWVWHRLPCYGCNWICKFERAHCVTDIPLSAIRTAIDSVVAQIEFP